MSVDKFEFKAGTGLATECVKDDVGKTEDDAMILIGAHLDESVKWVDMPGEGKIDVVSTKWFICPMCHNVKKGLRLDKHVNGKRVCVVECGNQYVFFGKEEK